MVLTYWVFQHAPTGFIPQQDQGRLIVSVQLPDSASLQRTKAAMELVDKIARETPGVAHTITISGMSFLLQSNASNFGSMFIVLDPFDKRRAPGLHAEDIMARLLPEFRKRVKDAIVSVRNSSPIPGLGVAGGFKIMVEDRGGRGLADLQSQTDGLTRKLQDVPGLADVQTGFRSNAPQIYLDIDRTKSVALGVPFEDVNQTLSMFLGSLYVNSFNQFGRHWQVTVQAEGQYRDRIEALNLFQVRNKWGEMVPLGTLVNVNQVKSDRGGPIVVTRYNLYTSASITGNMLPGFSSGDAIASINEVARESLPLSMKGEWTELMFVQIRAAERNPALYIFGLAVVSVFLALAALYESWALPLAVILVVPMCLFCSVSGVRYTNRDVNIFVQIGLVVLVGLACKNAILIVEYAKQKHREGWSRHDATREACRLRLRPILMTSFAFIIGVIPLAVAAGAGAEMRRSLGIAVFSGMLGVTLFGIFLTPVFFSVIQGLSETRMFTAVATRWAGSTLLSGLAGLGIGFMLAQAWCRSIVLGLAGRRLRGMPGRPGCPRPSSDDPASIVRSTSGSFFPHEVRYSGRRSSAVISRFFIDRPVFAIVLSVVFVLAGGVAVFTLPVAQYPEVTPPTVLVTAFYPGANAQTVRNTVAAPIEEQVSGVENMMYMSSQCTNDGAYNLTVTFRLGMNTDMAQVLVQNRVSLALPVIPPLVQNEGISVKKMSPNTLMIVNLISPDGQYDSTFLSNYATIYIKDELGRLPGVAGITYLGQRDYSLRAWLDPQKLASRNLSATDVITAISQQNLQVAAGQIGQQPVPMGQQFQLTINTLGRLVEPEQFGAIILKAGGQSNPQMQSSGGSSNAQGGQSQGGQSSEMVRGRRRLIRAARTARAARCRRRPASSGCATWPASSWARGSMTKPALWTAARRWRSPSTSCPVPMRSKPPMACTPR